MKLKDQHVELQEKINAISEKIKAKILELPDNPNIKRVGGGFTMSIKEIFKNDSILSPEYYDFKSQYKKIAEAIENNKQGNVFAMLENICKNPKTSILKMKLHPEVVAHLKNMLENL